MDVRPPTDDFLPNPIKLFIYGAPNGRFWITALVRMAHVGWELPVTYAPHSGHWKNRRVFPKRTSPDSKLNDKIGWVADSLLMGWLSRTQTSYHRHRGPQVPVAGSYSCVQTGLSFESTCHTNASPVRLARRHGLSPTSSGHRHSKRFARVIQPLLLRRLPGERHGLLSPARPTHPRQSLPKV